MDQFSKYCGWVSSIDEFLQVDEVELISSLHRHHLKSMNESASVEQNNAWHNCYTVLKAEMNILDPSLKHATIIFEYELPREKGRRPDILVLSDDYVLVFEFKDKKNLYEADIDQARAYGRDLQNYHHKTRNKSVIPFLVLTKSNGLFEESNGVSIISPEYLSPICTGYLSKSNSISTDFESWVQSDYDPLPTLVQAARDIFEHESLPQIKRALSYGIPQTLKTLELIAKNAEENKEKHLSLITGVPGAGKTLVGLQFVYSSYFSNLNGSNRAVFLSGNGPLIEVLQHALKSKVFVQDVHGFLKTYGGESDRIPVENIWVYDEAQRAWDSDRVKEIRGHGRSEPLDFLCIGERKGDWALMIGLIGEGQEIHLGEETGLIQWNEAIENVSSDWIVNCPSSVSKLFSSAYDVKIHDELNLNKTIRSHLAEEIHLWVNLLLESEIEDARIVAETVKKKGFDMYCTRDLDAAKNYVKERYKGSLNKRYGLLASSKAKKLGVHNEYNWAKNFRPGPWYNDAPSSENSCCQLEEVATEFSCQGLELDFPIVCWGNDLKWIQSKFVPVTQTNSTAKDPCMLRINSYRVLLTRGRDGLIIYLPNHVEMDETHATLLKAGVLPLSKIKPATLQ